MIREEVSLENLDENEPQGVDDFEVKIEEGDQGAAPGSSSESDSDSMQELDTDSDDDFDFSAASQIKGDQGVPEEDDGGEESMQKYEDSVISEATASTGVGTLSISEDSLRKGSSFA